MPSPRNESEHWAVLGGEMTAPKRQTPLLLSKVCGVCGQQARTNKLYLTFHLGENSLT